MAAAQQLVPNLQWFDVSDPNSPELDELARRFNLHPLQIEDCRHRPQRAKVDEYGPYLFAILKHVIPKKDGRLHFDDFDVFLGTDFLITQVFFSNADYFAFVERARAAGIGLPILPGIMPITDVGGVKRLTAMCGSTIPAALERRLAEAEGDPGRVLEVGVAHATEQCRELLARGVPGIHFYTLNKSPATRQIVAALKT